jgi:hypothetical protein
MPLRPSPTTPLLLQRRVAIAACVVVVAITLLGVAGPAWNQVLYGLLTDGVFLLAWIAAAAGFGGVFFRLPPRPRPVSSTTTTVAPAVHVDVARVATPALEKISIPGAASVVAPVAKDVVVGVTPLKFVTAIALGLGVMSLVTLALGLAGAMSRPAAVAMIAVGVALGVIKLVRADFTRDRAANWLTARSTWSWLWLAAAPVVGRRHRRRASRRPACCGAMSPTATTCSNTTCKSRASGTRPAASNGSTTTSSATSLKGVETHFYLAMQLRGGPWAGMYLAQLMHATMTLLAGVATFAAGRRARAARAGDDRGRRRSWARRGSRCSRPSRTTRAGCSSTARWRSGGR